MMEVDLFSYLGRLELMAFFSAYPLVYALFYVFAGAKNERSGFKQRLVKLLPFAYALAGSLYLGLQLKNLFPDYSFEHIKLAITNPWLSIWGVLSLLFWVPVFANRPLLSFFHSLVFFFFLLKDLFLHLTGEHDKSMLKNTMNVYTTSLMLNLLCLVITLGLSYLFFKRKKPGSNLHF